MNQKTITIIAVVVIIGATAGLGKFYFDKNNAVDSTEKNYGVITKDSTKFSGEVKKVVDGKVRSLNDKQVYVELSDGSGAAINIEPGVLVKNKGKEADITFLKPEAIVSINTDENSNALEILIK